MTGIEVHFYHLAFYISQNSFNILINAFYKEKLVDGQIIILNKIIKT